MKLSLLLFFAFGTPVVLFLAVVLYGGITTAEMKKAIADSGAYSQIGAHFAQEDAATIAQNNVFNIIISHRLTPTYIQTKTESVIDDSAKWITDRTQTPPSLSLKELKDELVSENSNILKTMEHIPTATELQESNLNSQEQAHYLKQAQQLATFANGNFTFSLAAPLEGIKTVYKILQIAVPLLIILLLISLFFLVKLPYNLPGKYKWLGATLLTSSIVGYGCILLQPYLTTVLTATHLLQQSDFLSLLSPIILAIINYYGKVYVGYQEIVNAIFLVGAAVCFLGAILTRNQAAPKIKPLYKIRSYWETPLKDPQPNPSEEAKER